MAKRLTGGPTGRPTKWKDENVRIGGMLAELGATEEEIARALGVRTVTLWRWKSIYPEFKKAISAGKEAQDERVVSAIFQRAIGYTHEDIHVSSYQGEVTLTPILKHYPPDPGACQFWLKNRQGDKWKDKPIAPTGEFNADDEFL